MIIFRFSLNREHGYKLQIPFKLLDYLEKNTPESFLLFFPKLLCLRFDLSRRWDGVFSYFWISILLFSLTDFYAPKNVLTGLFSLLTRCFCTVAKHLNVNLFLYKPFLSSGDVVFKKESIGKERSQQAFRHRVVHEREWLRRELSVPSWFSSPEWDPVSYYCDVCCLVPRWISCFL